VFRLGPENQEDEGEGEEAEEEGEEKGAFSGHEEGELSMANCRW
jgi:hypothetical protein